MGWSATLGSLCTLLFGVMGVTGVFLAMYYNPSPDKAYQSIDYIMNHVHLGRLLRGIHHWGAGAMVIAVFVHMLTNFFSGSFRAPRELTWMIGVCLFLVTLGLGFTGYLLPWDQKAYWATVVSANIPGDIPVAGLWIKRILLAGDTVSGLTLTRFYAIHMLLLPGLMTGLIFVHVYLVRIHGPAEHPVAVTTGKKPDPGTRKGLYRFFPEHLARGAVVFSVVFLAILILSWVAEVPREDLAGTVDETYLPRPEWYYMWLFQLLTYFSGATETIGSLVIPAAIVLILFALPFLSRSTLRAFADRPLATATGISCIIGIVFLTLMGFAGARPYGTIVTIPDRKLTDLEARGLFVFADRECAYCHHILGKGGRREGPDLSNVVAKDRTRDWLVKYIRDPKALSRWTTMPKYDLSEGELNALAAFVLSLDFDRHRPRTVSREEALGMEKR
ncbi:MAG: cytochrome b N-terminal domain-containing protein [Deltaproteobacteria bacterium]|nr:cytochrome b N-terminal domain-containing protein [Deltaproteobacteria bacterium]